MAQERTLMDKLFIRLNQNLHSNKTVIKIPQKQQLKPCQGQALNHVFYLNALKII